MKIFFTSVGNFATKMWNFCNMMANFNSLVENIQAEAEKFLFLLKKFPAQAGILVIWVCLFFFEPTRQLDASVLDMQGIRSAIVAVQQDADFIILVSICYPAFDYSSICIRNADYR